MRITTAGIIVIIVLLFVSCKKSEDPKVEEQQLLTTELKGGLPDDPSMINGYFYAGVLNRNNTSFSIDGYGVLTDPAANLMGTFDHYSDFSQSGSTALGKISVGTVSFNGGNLFQTKTSVSTSYRIMGSGEVTAPLVNARWRTTGNGSFVGFDIDLTSRVPLITNAFMSNFTNSISISQGLSLNIENSITNYDSLIVGISRNVYDTNPLIKKRLGSGAKTVNFSKDDLSVIQTGSGVIKLYAYNYSHKIIENVMYVFELSNKFQLNISVNP